MDLTTLARVKALAKDTSSANDAWYAQAISAISAAIERETGRWFERKQRTEKFRPDGDISIFFLRALPVASIDEVKNDGAIVDATEYRLLDDIGAIEFESPPLPSFDGRLEVKYTGGLAADVATLVATAEYLDVVGVCEREVLALWQRRDRIAPRLSESVGGSSLTLEYPDGFLPETLRVIERYRLP